MKIPAHRWWTYRYLVDKFGKEYAEQFIYDDNLMDDYHKEHANEIDLFIDKQQKQEMGEFVAEEDTQEVNLQKILRPKFRDTE